MNKIIITEEHGSIFYLPMVCIVITLIIGSIIGFTNEEIEETFGLDDTIVESYFKPSGVPYYGRETKYIHHGKR